MKYYSRDKPPDVPKKVAVCPVCNGQVKILDITDWYPDTGEVSEFGLVVTCTVDEDCILSDIDTYNWYLVDQKIVDWLNANYRMTKFTESEEQERLALWNQSAKQFASMQTVT